MSLFVVSFVFVTLLTRAHALPDHGANHQSNGIALETFEEVADTDGAKRIHSPESRRSKRTRQHKLHVNAAMSRIMTAISAMTDLTVNPHYQLETIGSLSHCVYRLGKQQWFNFRTSKLEHVMAAYIRGSEKHLLDQLEFRVTVLQQNVYEPPAPIAKFLRPIKGIFAKLWNLVQKMIYRILQPVRGMLANLIVKAYNVLKQSIAQEECVRATEFDLSAAVEKLERPKLMDYIMPKKVVQMAYDRACALIDDVIKLTMATLQVIVDERLNIATLDNGLRELSASVILNIENWMHRMTTSTVRASLLVVEKMVVQVLNHVKLVLAKGHNLEYDAEKLDAVIGGDGKDLHEMQQKIEGVIERLKDAHGTAKRVKDVLPFPTKAPTKIPTYAFFYM